MSFKKFQFY